MKIEIKKASTPEEQQAILNIRKAVFVDEQRVDERLEFEHEEESHHFLALADGVPAGCARWRPTEKGIKLERFAVLKNFRNKGIGNALVLAVLKDVPQQKKLYLHAQESAVFLYQNNGFGIVGDAFEEAGIVHFLMVKD